MGLSALEVTRAHNYPSQSTWKRTPQNSASLFQEFYLTSTGCEAELPYEQRGRYQREYPRLGQRARSEFRAPKQEQNLPESKSDVTFAATIKPNELRALSHSVFELHTTH